jgi:hypothetical protein
VSTDSDLTPVALAAQRVLLALNGLVIVLVTIWEVWATWVAFFGGTLPVPGGRLIVEGSLLLGALFVFVGAPVVYGIARLVTLGLSALIFMIVALPGTARRTARQVTPMKPVVPVAAMKSDTVTVRFRNGTVTFARMGDKTEIRASGFGGRPTPEAINSAKAHAREQLRSQGRDPWF